MIPAGGAAAPLVALGGLLDPEATGWAGRESWAAFSLPSGPYTVKALTAARDALVTVVETYGPAVTVRLALTASWRKNYPDARTDLSLGADAAGEELDRYLEQFRNLERQVKVQLTVELDKRAWAGHLLGRPVEGACTAVLFPQALRSWFGSLGGVQVIERDAWGDDAERRWLVLVPDWRSDEEPGHRLLRGPYLTLFGGDPTELPSAADGAGERRPSATAVRALGERDVHWEQRWLSCLTPLHLRLSGEVPADDLDVAPLRRQLAHLAVLFTADSVRRARVDDGRPGDDLVATFRGPDRQANLLLPVRLPGVGLPLDKAALRGIDTWGELVEWAYADDKFAGDRLAVVQNVLCREAWTAAGESTPDALLPRMPAILEQVRHNWKAFIESKVDAFFTQAQSLEEHVAEAVRSFAAQTDELFKKLSETMLATVGVVLAALVLPSATRGEVDLRVLWWGILVYALYVLLFPGLYGLSAQWQGHQAQVTSFEARYERFKRLLPSYWIEAVSREQVDRGVHRYRVRFWLNVGAYLLLLGGLGITLVVLGLVILF